MQLRGRGTYRNAKGLKGWKENEKERKKIGGTTVETTANIQDPGQGQGHPDLIARMTGTAEQAGEEIWMISDLLIHFAGKEQILMTLQQ